MSRTRSGVSPVNALLIFVEQDDALRCSFCGQCGHALHDSLTDVLLALAFSAIEGEDTDVFGLQGFGNGDDLSKPGHLVLHGGETDVHLANGTGNS